EQLCRPTPRRGDFCQSRLGDWSKMALIDRGERRWSATGNGPVHIASVIRANRRTEARGGMSRARASFLPVPGLVHFLGPFAIVRRHEHHPVLTVGARPL